MKKIKLTALLVAFLAFFSIAAAESIAQSVTKNKDIADNLSAANPSITVTPSLQTPAVSNIQETAGAIPSQTPAAAATEKVNKIMINESDSGENEGITAASSTASEQEDATEQNTPTSVSKEKSAASKTDDGGVVILADTKDKLVKNDYILVERSGFISDDFKKDGYVYNLEDWDTMQQGDYCFIKMTVGENVKPGVEFLAYSDDKSVSDPVTGENLGKMIIIEGIGKIVEKVDEGIWKVKIIKNYNILYNHSKITLRQDFKDYFDSVASKVKMRTGQIEGYIVDRQNGYTNGIKVKDIIYIDKGMNNGLVPGLKMDVIRSAPDSEKGTDGSYNVIGAALIIDVMKKTSTAVIIRNTDLIQVGDMVKTQK